MLLRLKQWKNKVLSLINLVFFVYSFINIDYYELCDQRKLKTYRCFIYSFIGISKHEPVSKNLIFVSPNLNSYGTTYTLTLFTLFSVNYFICGKIISNKLIHWKSNPILISTVPKYCSRQFFKHGIATSNILKLLTI
jgi:hypothetical protein